MATQQQLDEARQALHRLRIGKQAVKVQREGKLVEYTPADASALEQYIKQLELALGQGVRRRTLGFRL
ncbi:MAG: gpW family protein [Marinobacterium sp.]|nr:gpW family protein [Marinobacterium sp.]